MEKKIPCISCLKKFKIKKEKEEDFLNFTFLCQECIDKFGKDVKIEMIDMLTLVDCIKHLDSLEDTLRVNRILKKNNINRKIKW